MSPLVTQLLASAEHHKGTELARLLDWAAMHIQEQDEALKTTCEELEQEMNGRLRLENAANTASVKIEAAFHAVRASLPCYFDHIGRDMSGHINLMAGHGDPDYLTRGGMSIRHVDLRESKPIKSKKTGGKA